MQVKRNPLVTVITATYNNFHRFFDTMNSVIGQDYPSIQYIITDDGSSNFPIDEYERLVSGYSGSVRFTLIKHEKNIGTVKNLNSAILASDGEYIIPLSCNDLFLNSHVISDIVDEFLRSECEVIVTSRLLCDKQGKLIAINPHVLERRIINSYRDKYELYISGRIFDMISGSTSYYKKGVLYEYGLFDESYRLLEDAPFFEKYMWEHDVVFRYDIISILYENAGVSSSRSKNKAFEADWKTFKTIQRCSHIDKLSRKTQRILKYSNELEKHDKRIQRARVYFTHPIISIGNYLNRIRRKVYSLYDHRQIKQIERYGAFPGNNPEGNKAS